MAGSELGMVTTDIRGFAWAAPEARTSELTGKLLTMTAAARNCRARRECQRQQRLDMRRCDMASLCPQPVVYTCGLDVASPYQIAHQLMQRPGKHKVTRLCQQTADRRQQIYAATVIIHHFLWLRFAALLLLCLAFQTCCDPSRVGRAATAATVEALRTVCQSALSHLRAGDYGNGPPYPIEGQSTMLQQVYLGMLRVHRRH